MLSHAKFFTYQAFHIISVHRFWRHSFAEDHSKPRGLLVLGFYQNLKRRTGLGAIGMEYCGKLFGFGKTRSFRQGINENQPLYYTLNRVRPLARRARITAAPPRVLMRTKNPWVLLRLVVDG